MDDLLSMTLQGVANEIEQGNSRVLGNFWNTIVENGAPLVEPAGPGSKYVTFIWRDDGTTTGVDVIQDWGADGIREHSMAKLPGTDIWYKTRRMPADTHTTYQLAPEPLPAAFAGGVPFIPDPLNPQRFSPYFDETGFTIWFSLLKLPDAPEQPWLNATVPPERLTLHTPFEDGRRIWVYTPVNVVDASLLVAFDGRMAKELIHLPEMLETHIAAQNIRPTVAVMLDNPDRRELTCDATFADYVARRVVPWARENFPVSAHPAQTVVNGTSYGGLCAAYTALNYPDVFGGVLSQTGWFRWHPDNEIEHLWLAREYVARPVQNLRFYLDVGRLEIARMLDNGPSQLAANRHMRDVLRAKGYDVQYREYSGGHDGSSTASPLFEALPLMLK